MSKEYGRTRLRNAEKAERWIIHTINAHASQFSLGTVKYFAWNVLLYTALRASDSEFTRG